MLATSLIASRLRRHRWLTVLLIWALGAAALVIKIAKPHTAPRDVDESYWIGSAYYYHLAFQNHAWRHPDWGLLPARENPPLAKYVIGAGLSAAGQRVPDAAMLGSFFAMSEYAPTAWGDAEGRAKRDAVASRLDPKIRNDIANGAEPHIPPELLVPARRAMLVCIVLASLLVLLLGVVSIGPIPALLASLGFLAHPHIGYYANRALSESVVLLFSTAAALAIAALVRPVSLQAPPSHPAWRRGMLIGMLLGLACAAKMNAAVLIVAYALFVATAVAPLARAWPWLALRHLLTEGAVAAGATLAMFALVNPAILNDPLGGLSAVVREHRITEGIQATFIKGHLTTFAQKIHAVVGLGYFGWGCFAGVGIAAGWALSTNLPALRFLALWWLVALTLVTWWIPFDWMRYLTPLIVPSLLLGAWATWRFVTLFWTTTRQALANPA